MDENKKIESIIIFIMRKRFIHYHPHTNAKYPMKVIRL